MWCLLLLFGHLAFGFCLFLLFLPLFLIFINRKGIIWIKEIFIVIQWWRNYISNHAIINHSKFFFQAWKYPTPGLQKCPCNETWLSVEGAECKRWWDRWYNDKKSPIRWCSGGELIRGGKILTVEISIPISRSLRSYSV
jgi:hypothetical protein